MTDAARRLSSGALALSIAALLSACQQRELIVPKIPGLEPYRMTIQQGNYLSQEMVAQLKLGMTREQVRFVLGTPLVQDAFHADRWDYVFYREVPGAKREQRNLSVMFEKDRLVRVIGDLVPPEGAAPQPTGFAPQVKPEAPAAKPAPVAPKPAAETAKPAAEPAKPAAVAEPEPPTQNWRAASDEPEKAPEAAPAGTEAPKPPAEQKAEDKDAEEPKERGFFGRLLQKIGL
jgi:outer membrane protein assembly factor BamE